MEGVARPNVEVDKIPEEVHGHVLGVHHILADPELAFLIDLCTLCTGNQGVTEIKLDYFGGGFGDVDHLAGDNYFVSFGGVRKRHGDARHYQEC
ncbi:hypothetical protein D9M69_594720 [compost metagenome]